MAQRDLNSKPDTTHRRPLVDGESIQLVFERFQAFVDEYRSKISVDGMFLETAEVKPAGATISCEFKLTDGFRLCKAMGQVSWSRSRALDQDHPAGMGIRFQALDDQGRALIQKIVEEHVKNGGRPFALEPPPADLAPPPAAPEPPPSPGPPSPREDPASTHSRPALQKAGVVADESAADSRPSVKAPDFGAPWGQELPTIPDEVIEPIDEETVLASAHEDFSSDADEAGFSPTDPELLEIESVDDELSPEPFDPELAALPVMPLEAPDEISFADEPVDGDADAAELSASPEVDFDFESPLTDTPDFSLLAEASTPQFDLTDETPPDTLVQPPDFVDVDEAEADGFEVEEQILSNPLAAEPADPGPDVPGVETPLDSELPGPGTSPAGGLESPPPAELLSPTDFTDPSTGFTDADPLSTPEPPGKDETPGTEAAAAEFAEPTAGTIPPISPNATWGVGEANGGWYGSSSETDGFLSRLKVSLAESKGRILLVTVLLAAVGVSLVFKEQVLDLVGLASPPAQDVPAPPLSDPGGPTSPEVTPDGSGATAEETADPGAANPGAAGEGDLANRTEPELIEVSASPPSPEQEPPPPVPAPPPPVPAPPPQRAGASATRVEDIDFDQVAEGTRITIVLDGAMARDRYEHNLLDYDPLKEQIVIRGIGTPFRSKVAVGTLELEQIRSGLHGDELKLVFDLTSGAMTLSEIRPQGNHLEILVRRR